MKKFIILIIYMLFSIHHSDAQENIYTWQGENIISDTKYTPAIKEDFSIPSGVTQYLITDLNIKTPDNQDNYSLKLYRFNNNEEDNAIPYEKLTLSYKGHVILENNTNLMQTVACQTMNKSNAYYLQVPLEDKTFALLLGGWHYGYGEAPEMKIIVVKNDKAKIVFDNYAYAYKYQASPAFSMEFVDDVTWNEDNYEISGDYQVPSAAALKTRTKHRIWREGNMLKYESWK